MSFVDFMLDPVHVVSVSQDGTGRAHVKLQWRGVILPDISFDADSLQSQSAQGLQSSLQSAASSVIEDAIRTYA
jgi:hypothetical protein